MKTPPFWYMPHKRPPFFARLLEYIYKAARCIHVLLTKPTLLPVSTICIGNITAGGGGKTPTITALYALLDQKDSFILTRGYGGQCAGPLKVDVNRLTPEDVGDEALLHARIGPTIMSKDRLKGAHTITNMGGKLIFMDDGFQSRKVRAHINILVIDGKMGFGNGHMIPAGPLREQITQAIKRTQAIILIGPDNQNIKKIIPSHIPVFTARAEMDLDQIQDKGPFIAFAGIAWPDKFYAGLRARGITLQKTYDFPDHHAYTQAERANLIAQARASGAFLITTQKDAVKWPEPDNAALTVIPMHIIFDEAQALKTFIKTHLSLS